MKINQLASFKNSHEEWCNVICTGEEDRGYWFMFDGHQEFYIETFKLFELKKEGKFRECPCVEIVA